MQTFYNAQVVNTDKPLLILNTDNYMLGFSYYFTFGLLG